MRIVLAITALLTLPFFASAQVADPVGAVGAGFPERTIWVSNSKPASGEEIKVSTVLYNSTDGAVPGMLTFLQDGAAFNTQDVSLPPQSSSIISTSWSARSGTHALSARFVSKDGKAPTQETTVVRISVPEPPPPTPLQQSANKAAEVVAHIASSSAPAITQVAESVFKQTEAIRIAGAERLEQYIENSRHPAVEGASTRAGSAVTGFATPSTGKSKLGSTLNSVAQTAAAAAHFVFSSMYLFYPLFAFIMFALLAWAYRRFRRPHRAATTRAP